MLPTPVSLLARSSAPVLTTRFTVGGQFWLLPYLPVSLLADSSGLFLFPFHCWARKEEGAGYLPTHHGTRYTPPGYMPPSQVLFTHRKPGLWGSWCTLWARWARMYTAWLTDVHF